MVVFATISTVGPSYPVTRIRPLTLSTSRTFLPLPGEKSSVRRIVSLSSRPNRLCALAMQLMATRPGTSINRNERFIGLLQFRETLLRAFAHGLVDFSVLCQLSQCWDGFLLVQIHCQIDQSDLHHRRLLTRHRFNYPAADNGPVAKLP